MDETKRRWVAAGFEAIVDGGVGEVRVEALARGLGLTKGAFYHHFKNRQALLNAMLEAWQAEGTDAIIELVERERTPRSRFTALIEAIFTPKTSDPIEAAIRAWAASDDKARVATNGVDHRRLSFVTTIFIDHGMPLGRARLRAEAFYRVVIGHFMWLSAGGVGMTAEARADLVVVFLGEDGDVGG